MNKVTLQGKVVMDEDVGFCIEVFRDNKYFTSLIPLEPIYNGLLGFKEGAKLIITIEKEVK